MNGFDVALLVLLAVLALVGLVKGLTRILIGIGGLVAAFLLAARYHDVLAERLDLSPERGALVAYCGIFFGTLLVGAVVAFLARRLVKAAMLSWVDRLAGAALGLVAAMLVAGLIVLPLVAYSSPGGQALRGSRLAPYVSVVADLATRLVPDELSERYQRRMDDLRRYWREQASGRSQREA